MVMFKRIGFPSRTIQIEARIGNKAWSTSHGRKAITINRKCGATSSSSSASVATFTCWPRLDGRYLTLQSMAPMMLNIAEVNIYRSGETFYETLGLTIVQLRLGNKNVHLKYTFKSFKLFVYTEQSYPECKAGNQ